MIRWIMYALCVLALLSWQVVHGLECQVFQHANGSTSYNLTGGQSPTNCSFQWSDNGTVIAHEDEIGSGQHEEVLSQDSYRILLKTCRKGVHYKEDCPASGVFNSVQCPYNCSIRDADQPKVNGGSYRTHIVPIVILIVFLLFVAVLTIVCCCRGNSSGGWCAVGLKGDRHGFLV
ncbi:hypothetical protein ANANG_G00008110 [Anguilla anguilla]|uniref:Uncharacterized protein n=1 Tax=Anguilla anguilla TaxID=7936 RepID=A0A9D3SAZ3_ANGAN|nr:hypothetical protein ANANG_G00008110 [Anguilla anguilla]